jgi:hypothetical protein
MKPDGYLFVHIAVNPSTGVSPVQLKIPFDQIRGHKPEHFGLRIEFPDKRVIIPWSNILDLEIHFNSEEYKAWWKEEGSGSDEL